MDTKTFHSETLIPANIHISHCILTIGDLIERLKNHGFDLQPNSQKQTTPWTPEDQSRLIESLMLKIPLPAFHFDATNEEKWRVIDGTQRLYTIRDFLVGIDADLKPFSGFQYFMDFNGRTYDQLPRQYIRRIRDTQITSYTIEKGTPDTVVQNIFQRINTSVLNKHD